MVFGKPVRLLTGSRNPAPEEALMEDSVKGPDPRYVAPADAKFRLCPDISTEDPDYERVLSMFTALTSTNSRRSLQWVLRRYLTEEEAKEFDASIGSPLDPALRLTNIYFGRGRARQGFVLDPLVTDGPDVSLRGGEEDDSAISDPYSELPFPTTPRYINEQSLFKLPALRTGAQVPIISRAILTVTEQKILQTENTKLREQLKTGRYSCPFNDCEFRWAMSDPKTMRQHLMTDHMDMSCFLCDAPVEAQYSDQALFDHVLEHYEVLAPKFAMAQDFLRRSTTRILDLRPAQGHFDVSKVQHGHPRQGVSAQSTAATGLQKSGGNGSILQAPRPPRQVPQQVTAPVKNVRFAPIVEVDEETAAAKREAFRKVFAAAERNQPHPELALPKQPGPAPAPPHESTGQADEHLEEEEEEFGEEEQEEQQEQQTADQEQDQEQEQEGDEGDGGQGEEEDQEEEQEKEQEEEVDDVGPDTHEYWDQKGKHRSDPNYKPKAGWFCSRCLRKVPAGRAPKGTNMSHQEQMSYHMDPLRSCRIRHAIGETNQLPNRSGWISEKEMNSKHGSGAKARTIIRENYPKCREGVLFPADDKTTATQNTWARDPNNEIFKQHWTKQNRRVLEPMANQPPRKASPRNRVEDPSYRDKGAEVDSGDDIEPDVDDIHTESSKKRKSEDSMDNSGRDPGAAEDDNDGQMITRSKRQKGNDGNPASK